MGRIRLWCSECWRRGTERDGKVALLGSGAIIFVQFALFLVLGVMLFVFYRGAAAGVVPADPDQIFPAFIVTQMPPGIAGLVLAAILAVAMSNASGSLNSLASSSIMDFGRGARAGGGAANAAGNAAQLLERAFEALAMDDFDLGRGAG